MKTTDRTSFLVVTVEVVCGVGEAVYTLMLCLVWTLRGGYIPWERIILIVTKASSRLNEYQASIRWQTSLFRGLRGPILLGYFHDQRRSKTVG